MKRSSTGRFNTNSIVQNLLLERQLWLRRQLDPRRDIDAECGHPACIEVTDYLHAFLRGDLATRVVSVFPEESWSESPQIFENQDETETDFEKAWLELDDQFNLLSILLRADILSGIGRFGIILIGLDDGADLATAVPGVNDRGEKDNGAEHELLFLRALDESVLEVKELEQNPASPRYGMPKTYEVTFDDVENKGVNGKQIVHWTRVVHLADNRMTSEIYGRPRMEKVFDRLLDVKKIGGGSGEMFWKGGFPGISLESVGNGEDVEFDEEATKEQIEAYMNGLQRYIATLGMKAQSLNVQVADPGPHLEVQIRLIAMSLGIPWRVLVGSEAAQLASEQDMRAWNRRVNRRRQGYVTPFIIKPFLNRLIAYGVLPQPEKTIVLWPDLNSPGDRDKAEVAERRTNALMKYVMGGVDALVPPFHFLTLVLGYTDVEAHSIIDEMGDDLMKIQSTASGAQAAADAKAQAAAKGSGAGRNKLGVGTGRQPTTPGRKQPASTAN